MDEKQIERLEEEVEGFHDVVTLGCKGCNKPASFQCKKYSFTGYTCFECAKKEKQHGRV